MGVLRASPPVRRSGDPGRLFGQEAENVINDYNHYLDPGEHTLETLLSDTIANLLIAISPRMDTSTAPVDSSTLCMETAQVLPSLEDP